ncbi:MAG: chromosomal replication initiator protein DnaA, partial [Patescibacteria group bacterium]
MDLDRLWKTVLGEVEILVTKPTFGTFFASTRILSLEKGVAVVGCANAVSVMMMETRYYSLIKKSLDTHTKQNTSIIFKIAPFPSARQETPGPLFMTPASPTTESLVKVARLRSDFTFESFAVSTSNQMAYAAATAVADTPGTSYNPLFLYGGVGVGKTHLMQAIGNQVLSKKQTVKIIYCAGEEFTNEIIDAIQTKTTKRFKDKYRSARILLIDDVQFLQGKLRVQEEFFHTFNAVTREGGQVVLTSDRPPHEIDRLEERLQSRFEGGLIVDVQNPDFELRCAILRIKAQQKGALLPVSTAQILAANVESVRKLEGLLTRILTEAMVKKVPVSDDLARSIVGKPKNETTENKRISSPKEVTDVVLRRFGLTLTQIRSARRSRPLARPRQVLMYLLRTELRLPLS